MDNKQEVSALSDKRHGHALIHILQMIDIIETVYRGASKGRGLVVSPKGMSNSWLIPLLDSDTPPLYTDYSTRYRY